MRLHEAVDAVEMVDRSGVLDIRLVGRLVPIAKPHQGLVRPGIVVQHGNLDDARLEQGMPGSDRLFDRLDLTQQVVRLDDIRIVLHLERRVCRTDLGDALEFERRGSPW